MGFNGSNLLKMESKSGAWIEVCSLLLALLVSKHVIILIKLLSNDFMCCYLLRITLYIDILQLDTLCDSSVLVINIYGERLNLTNAIKIIKEQICEVSRAT